VSATTQPQTSSQPSTSWPQAATNGDMQGRYEKAMRRAEQLSYAAAIFGVLILVLIVLGTLFPWL
jgi:hypothetical protein